MIRRARSSETSLRLAAAALAAGCGSDYLHVVVEGSSPDLTAATPVTIEVAAFGGDQRLDHVFTSRFQVGVSGSQRDARATDFNLVLDHDVEDLDLRVGVATPNTRWSASLVATPPLDGETRRLVLHAGDTSMGTARLGVGEPLSVVAYKDGIASAWSSAEGVSLRIDGNPDQPLARPDPISTDRSATHVQVAAPRSAVGTADRFAVAWLGAEGGGHLLLYRDDAKHGPYALGATTEIHVACPAGAAAAVLTRSGTVAKLTYYGDDGAPQSAVTVTGDARETLGVVAAGTATVAGVRTGDGWHLVRIVGGAVTMSPVIDELLAMSASTSGDAVLTVQRSGVQMLVRPFDAVRLEIRGDASEVTTESRLPAGIFRAFDIAPCAVTWPEQRRDRSGAVDLWVRDLSGVGTGIGDSRVLPGSWNGSYLAPRLACTPTAAYALFAVAGDLQVRTGTVALRHVPPPPP